ncbi:MAG: ABC transporter [Gammaproteobacteria bacterium]|nr:ABC transporter [Gammaproteobacteria bacterium]
MTAAKLTANAIECHLGTQLALDNISLTAEPGQLTGIIGTNGAGKSTLLSVLAGVQSNFRGSVSIGSKQLEQMTPNERARLIAYLPQNPQVHWDLTAQQVTELGRVPYRRRFNWLGPVTAADQQAVTAAMAATQCQDLARRPIQSLSNGEHMRVHLARVLAVKAPIILVDEPTNGLDPYQQIHCLEVLRDEARKGGTVVMVLHDLDLAARFCDQLLLLHNNQVLSHGNPAEVLTPAHLLTAYRIKPPAELAVNGLNLANWERQTNGTDDF